MSSGFAKAPLRVRIWRGEAIESEHLVTAAVVNASGVVVQSFGEIQKPIFPRSAVKMIQALPLLETGAASAFRVSDSELALACSSHTGEPIHQKIASTWLQRLDLPPSALKCGGHPPSYPPAAFQEFAQHGKFTIFADNCSGKHVGMLCTAVHMKEDSAGYLKAEHPVQIRVRDQLSAICDYPLRDQVPSIDGCGIPTFLIPPERLALGMARFVTTSALPESLRAHCQRIAQAMVSHPELVGGTDEYVTEMMKLGEKKLLLKVGAEGVMAAALIEKSIGIAVKVHDGAERAAEAATTALLRLLGFWPKEIPHPLLQPIIKNRAGRVVGHLDVISDGEKLL